MRAAGSPRLRSRLAADRSGNNLPDGRVYSRAASAPASSLTRGYATAGSGAPWTAAGRASERRRLPQTSAPTAKMPAAHQKAVT
jgi:hypothetical protein